MPQPSAIAEAVLEQMALPKKFVWQVEMLEVVAALQNYEKEMLL